MSTFGFGSEVDLEFPARLAMKDTKTAVNEFCQRYCKRPVSKDDIVYNTEKYQTGFQSTVRLNCMEGKEFAGEVAPSQKDAEKSAGQQVLAFYADQISAMPKVGSKKKRAATGGDPLAKMARVGEAAPSAVALSAKSELNSTCSKIMRRVMEKGDVMYETHMVDGGYQATVTMPKLPGEWGAQVWAGEVLQKKQDAEQSAAGIALEALRSDPQLMAAHNAPPKPKNWTPGQGKGKGKSGVAKGGKGLELNPSAANQWNAAALGQMGMLGSAAALGQMGLMAGFGGFGVGGGLC